MTHRVALVLCAAVAGCAAPPNAELEAYLAESAPNYSEDVHMLGLAWDGPGYHSKVPDGTWVYPTRESLDYALCLLERGTSGDRERAERIVRSVIALQETRPEHDYVGVWPWLRQEPVDAMEPPDRNWADFCGARIAQILIDHGSSLDAAVVGEMRRSLRLAAEAIRKRDVKPGYTNIAIMGAGVAVAAGELLDAPELVTFGRAKMRAVVEHVAHDTNFREYNSPTYTLVALAECERALHLVRDRATRAAAQALWRVAWRTIVESYHPATQQWAGPHSRAYTDRLIARHVDLLSTRIGAPIAAHPAADVGPTVGFDPTPALPCPADLRAHFTTTPTTSTVVQRMFQRHDEPLHARHGVTWKSAEACLGSVNHAALWVQRRPLIGYWRTEEDPAVVLRLRALHDGRDFAALGVHNVQQQAQVLSLFYLFADRGDWHHHLDYPEGGIYRARDFRIRYELRGVGVTGRALGGGRFELVAGRHRALLHTRPGRFFGQPVRWELGATMDGVHVDAVLYNGVEADFDFCTVDAIELAAGLEIVPSGKPPAAGGLVVSSGKGVARARWGALRAVAAMLHGEPVQ